MNVMRYSLAIIFVRSHFSECETTINYAQACESAHEVCRARSVFPILLHLPQVTAHNKFQRFETHHTLSTLIVNKGCAAWARAVCARLHVLILPRANTPLDDDCD